MTSPISLTDVTLRDGLQAEAHTVSTNDKIQLFKLLLAVGYDRLEITSFVNPKWIPQLGDAEVFCEAAFAEKVSTPLMAFVPNEEGLERLLKYPIGWASLFIAASEAFNQKNVNRNIAVTAEEVKRTVALAHTESRKARVYISTVFGCPYQGVVSDSELKEVFLAVKAANPDEIALSDTIGVGTPQRVGEVVELATEYFPLNKLAFHFHDTYGMGLACSQRAMELGIVQFDGSTGGIGGCPYAKGATGNLATESLWYLFFREGRRPVLPVPALRTLFENLLKAGLSPRSPLAVIHSKGGKIYGC
ncbi:MAG: hydroxymethylglutaryl-CoA lyase [Deltaproteobacteria bacterium]|nr:hydroxymethylglutaryl-CoA lyase [Deltaproteobacteria bacterium]